MHATQNPATLLTRTREASLLRSAADYLDQYGWRRFRNYADDSDTPAADLLGAVAIACYGHPVDAPDIYHCPTDASPQRRMFAVCRAILDDFVGVHEMVDAQGNPMPYTLTDWNDELRQSKACVTAVLRAAANDYDRNGGAA